MVEPFLRYCSATFTRFSLKITTRCHSVFSLRSPLFLSRQLSEVASDRLQTRLPSCRERTSGSRPRLPTRMTLLTLPAIEWVPLREGSEAYLNGKRDGKRAPRCT